MRPGNLGDLDGFWFNGFNGFGELSMYPKRGFGGGANMPGWQNVPEQHRISSTTMDANKQDYQLYPERRRMRMLNKIPRYQETAAAFVARHRKLYPRTPPKPNPVRKRVRSKRAQERRLLERAEAKALQRAKKKAYKAKKAECTRTVDPNLRGQAKKNAVRACTRGQLPPKLLAMRQARLQPTRVPAPTPTPAPRSRRRSRRRRRSRWGGLSGIVNTFAGWLF